MLTDRIPPTSSEFFEVWHKEVPPRSSAEVDHMPDTAREIYRLYEEFYNPRQLDRIGGSEWGSNIYKKVKYCLVQNTILFNFVDTLNRDLLIAKEVERVAGRLHISMDSVRKGLSANNRLILKNYRGYIFDWPEPKDYFVLADFRPRTKFDTLRTLVLIPKYDTLLNQFLADNHYPLGAGNLMAPAASKGESTQRQAFLSNLIRIWYGHWGGYWQLHTYPYVNSVIFDRSFEHALINFRVVYEGGFACFKKVDGAWKLIDAERTWIE
jgi:hypothetical protein